MNADLPSMPGGTRAKANGPLLDTLLAIRASVGEGLNDDELTRLLGTTLLREAGFGFLSFSRGVATLTVPEQDPASWYSEQGWIAPRKERIARAIGKRYGLSLYKPEDTTRSFWSSDGQVPTTHHHIELANEWEAVVIAHPHYLKVRLLGRSVRGRYDTDALCPIALGPDLLKDLALLYQ